MNALAPIHQEFTHFHLFCGLGGGARGFNRARAVVKNLSATMRCVGGVDSDPASIRDFSRAAGVPGTVMDLFSTDQYVGFHGKAPPPGWREATPDDLRRAAGGEHPDVVFLSAPCKGFSGLLAETTSKTRKYQALNELTLRGVWLTMEAFAQRRPKLLIFENVPRIATRGRGLLDQIVAMLRHYGYAVAETTHDCGEIGGLAQSRKRFLLVARLVEQVPNYLYEPVKARLRGVGEVLGRLPLPGDMDTGGPMHRMPSLQWKTWVRLAFVEAGSDWRSLNKLNVADGVLTDFGIMPEMYRGSLGVTRWDEHAATISSRGFPLNGAYSVADPRVDGHEKSVQLGVRPWDRAAGVVTSKMLAGGGPHSVADPRLDGKPAFNNVFRIVPWAERSPAVAGPGGPAGGLAVADPRPPADDGYKKTKYRVTALDEAAGAVIAASTTGNGAFAVADPRPTHGPNAHTSKLSVSEWESESKTVTGSDRVGSGALSVADPRPARPPEELHGKFHVTPFGESSRAVIGGRENGAFVVADPRPDAWRDGKDTYKTGGHYGVVPYDEHAYSVTAHGALDNGNHSVADPRAEHGADVAEPVTLPAADHRLVCVIIARDETWHRPFTTLELAALQTLFDVDELFPVDERMAAEVADKRARWFKLDGESDSGWRERIGNAVPSDAAEAVGSVMLQTLLLAQTGETFALSAVPIWVQPVAVSLMAAQQRPFNMEDFDL